MIRLAVELGDVLERRGDFAHDARRALIELLGGPDAFGLRAT